MATINDYFCLVNNGTPAEPAQLSAPKTTVDTTASLSLATGWPTTTPVHIAIFKVGTDDEVTDGTVTYWKALLTGTTLSSMTLKGGTNQNYTTGDPVVILSPYQFNDLVTALSVDHNPDGTHKFTQVLDSNGNETLKLSSTASAVNEVTIGNSTTGNGPAISATGGDSNIDVRIIPKGTGRVSLAGAGAPQGASVATSESTALQTFSDLTTTTDTVTVTIGTSGMALVAINSAMINNGSGGVTYTGFAISGASTVAASDSQSIAYQAYANNALHQSSGVFLVTGLTAGSNTFKMKYRVSANTGTWANRRISVVPL